MVATGIMSISHPVTKVQQKTAQSLLYLIQMLGDAWHLTRRAARRLSLAVNSYDRNRSESIDELTIPECLSPCL